MKNIIKSFCALVVLLSTGVILSSFFAVQNASKSDFSFPYKKAGLSERQAAAHLLSRFTYGATPGQVDAVVKMGLEKWFEQQLDGEMADDSLNTLLTQYDALKMSNSEISATFPRGGELLRMAVKDGVINKDSVGSFKADRKDYRETMVAYLQKKGMKPQQELFRQFINSKVLRAAYSNNQLHEVLTDFWFNHFNVSITKNDCAEFIPDYERDVIRPNVTGKFSDLLLATAKSPAMLYYLDNFSSSAANANNNMPARFAPQVQNQLMVDPSQREAMMKKLQNARKAQGLNENYAREVMELHTLGVDGGYTQQDVTQAARVLTGWSIYPLGTYGNVGGIRKLMENTGEERLRQRGFMHDGDFLFNPNRHDTGEKVVLGKHFNNAGYQEGVDLLEMLAHHPSTAKFISKKIAVHFVSDTPDPALVNKMAKTFTNKDGDIRQVLITMVNAPEFWSANALREKTKSPFELAISAVRSLNAKIYQPYQLYSWVNKMGQKMYYYQAPTGFPDKGEYWINTGALLNRMNFGLALASQRIPGVMIDLAALNNHHEPESPDAALAIYAKLVMPERNLEQTIKQLSPMLNDPDLLKKVDDAASKKQPDPTMNMATNPDDMTMNNGQGRPFGKGNKNMGKNGYLAMQNAPGNNSMLSQVVGVIVGSPEFQRR